MGMTVTVWGCGTNRRESNLSVSATVLTALQKTKVKRKRVIVSLLVNQHPMHKPSTTTGNTMKSKLKGVVRAQILANSLGHNRTNAEVQHSRKNAALLEEIFPPHIADALREGRRVPQEKHECVTIFFSDIVGFSAMSRDLSPEKVADLLDRLYTRFDDLTRLHDVFKIETIGDAFMAAANLVKDQSVSHARRIAEFSIDAIKVANTTQIDRDDPSMGCLEIRVGFHSGPVTSGVVGTRLPKYGIFGDQSTLHQEWRVIPSLIISM